MRKVVVLLCVLGAICALVQSEARAQTTLEAGDLAFTGYKSTGADAVSFVLLRAVTAGTFVTFTDRGWLAGGGFRSGEGAFELTFDADYPCGSEFVAVQSPLEVLDAVGESAGTTIGGGLQFSTSGDQVFAHQGGVLVAGLQMNGGWDADTTSTNTSAHPAELVDGLHAFAIAPETNNARYDCGVVVAESTVFGAAIHDLARWETNDAAAFDLSLGCGFTCTTTCTEPEVPTVAGGTTILGGESTTLSIGGAALGDATAWQWYVDGCGFASVGSGPSVTLMPVVTTEIFVRGEGGCADPGTCASLTVTVESPPPAPQRKAQQKCLNTMLGQLGVAAGVQGKEVLKCAKEYSKGKNGSAQTCVTADAKGKMAKARSKVTDLQAKKCTELPDFGPSDGMLVADAAVGAGTGFFVDLFGVAFDGTILPNDQSAARKCQQSVASSARKCLDARLKEFARCAKEGLKHGSITSPVELAACIGADAKGKIAAACDLGVAGDKKVDLLRRSLGKLCVAADVLPSEVLPVCAGATTVEDAHGCLTPRIACRACRAADAAGSLGVACDDLDDGLPNGSCPV